MRLIDADALVKDIEDFQKSMVFHSYGERMQFDDMIDFAVDHLEDAPTIDAVPVVRCKDCWKQGGYQCPMFDDETYRDGSKEDGFCHDGERMESVLYD